MSGQPRVLGNRHMTSSGHILATQAGYDIFEAGGNAIDAGVAAGIALGVVHSEMVQFAGVAPIMIYLAERNEVVTISGLGPWPSAASIDYFIAEHQGRIPDGVRRTVVPAAPDAWLLALERFGTMTFAEVAAPAIDYAANGFAMHPIMHDYISAFAKSYARWDENAKIYLPDGRPPAVGERFVQADLARTIQFMADEEAAAGGSRAHGLDAARTAFYRGDIAEAIVRTQREYDGWLSRDDLASYRSEIEPARRWQFADVDVYTCGPWCQGPVLQQTLALLDPADLARHGHNEVDYIHTIVEATKLAFADREQYYGDPRQVAVPLDQLLDPSVVAARQRCIDPHRAAADLPLPTALGESAPSSRALGARAQPNDRAPASADTSYVCTVDSAGNLFSATPSDVSWEAPIVPGTGISPSTRGSQSWAVRGHASSVAPGKRPRLTPNPAIAIAPGQFAMPFGTPGGDNQTQAMLQVLINYALFQMPIQEAIDAPRFMSHSFPNSFEPHTAMPARLTVEGRVREDTTEALAARGHDVERLEAMTYKTAGVCAIVRDESTGILEGGADPRRTSRALGR